MSSRRPNQTQRSAAVRSETSRAQKRRGASAERLCAYLAGAVLVLQVAGLLALLRRPAAGPGSPPPSALSNHQLLASQLTLSEVAYNIIRAPSYSAGGESTIFITTEWEEPPGNRGSGIISAAWSQQPLAIKALHMPLEWFRSRAEFNEASARGRQGLEAELNALHLLHSHGCGERVVRPLGWVAWEGLWTGKDADPPATSWHWPTHAYVMPFYQRGSIARLLKDVCNGTVSEADAARFLSQHSLSSELHVLLGELHKVHTTPGVQLMLQDVTSNNLLVDDSGGALRLVLSDPAKAERLDLLAKPSGRHRLHATSFWGSPQAHDRQFDPTADHFGLSIAFLEMWLVAEGAPTPPATTILELGMELQRGASQRFVRHLVSSMLRLHLRQGDSWLPPRSKRHLPVSWLGAWVLLLGSRDCAGAGTSNSGMQHPPCPRPDDASMLELARLWRQVAEVAVELPEVLSAEAAQRPGCAALVRDMCLLHGHLQQLSFAEGTAGEHERRQDAPLAWVAANFMEQEHPLVLAMRQLGASGMGTPELLQAGSFQPSTWQHIVQAAQQHALHGIGAAL